MTRIAIWILISCGAAALATACGDDDDDGAASDSDSDGDCGTLAGGDSDISGHPVLDGSFAALLEMERHAFGVLGIRDQLLLAIYILCGDFGVECSGEAPVGEVVAELKDAIQATISASVSGAVEVCHVPPECSAGIPAAMAAMYECESGMGCDVDDGCLSSTTVQCMGQCHGACSGGCEGACEFEVSGGECWGTCDGTCETTTAEDCFGACEGICAGQCYGNWSGESCDGVCSGTCLGVCDTCAPQACPGGCTGICFTEAPISDLCEGLFHGSCEGECEGGCQGDVRVWSCNLDGACVASADCQRYPARLWARAAVACTEAEVEAYYVCKASLDAGAKAAFTAKMDTLAATFGPLEQATRENMDMVDPDSCNEVGYQPGLVVMLSVFEELWELFQDGDLDDGIDPAKYDCVEPAFEEAWALLDELLPEQQEVLAAQLELLEVLGI
jgi:hypothetical protein